MQVTMNQWIKEKNKIKNYKNNVAEKDICTLIKKCSIDEISKYLIKEAKKGFPDITQKQINQHEKIEYSNNWFRKYW